MQVFLMVLEIYDYELLGNPVEDVLAVGPAMVAEAVLAA